MTVPWKQYKIKSTIYIKYKIKSTIYINSILIKSTKKISLETKKNSKD